jgi:4-diphosphocytidyl-2-C-methyl-D-erythritol kinase
MHMLKETAYAKINLALHVRKRRDDGYHELETLFAFVDCGDELSFESVGPYNLIVRGEMASGIGEDDNNLITRAARLINGGNLPPVKIGLDKVLPVAAGLGGGSADAAATLRALSKMGFGDSTHDLITLSAALGADVPACIDSVPVIGVGIGTELQPVINDVAGMHCLLVNPRVPVSTPAVFGCWDGEDKGALPQGSARTILDHGRNDLATPAIELCPEIAVLLDYLRGTHASHVRMSGSGATCFALYDSDESATEAGNALSAMPERQQWWWRTGQLR